METETNPQAKINWKRILLAVLVGILLIGGGVAVWLLVGQPSTTPPSQTPSSTPSAETATPSAQVDETANWSVFKNKRFPYQLKYPKGWYITDKYCPGEDRSNSVLIDRNSAKIICDSSNNGLQVGEFSINAGPNHDRFPNVIPECKETQQNIEVAGIQAVKYYGPEKPCALPYGLKKKTWVFVNYKGVGYKIEFENSDYEGNYDPTYDQILSTFKFLD